MTAVMVWKTCPPGRALVPSRTKYAMAARKPKTPIHSRKVSKGIPFLLSTLLPDYRVGRNPLW
jgi:hypothetical protein